MRALWLCLPITALLGAPALAQDPDAPAYFEGGYTIEELLSPCVNADNDARWGVAAEIECEQYIMGFTDAFLMHAKAAGTEVCLPEQNRADEVRWAFMKWAKQHYDQRTRPAAEGMMETLHSAFACE